MRTNPNLSLITVNFKKIILFIYLLYISKIGEIIFHLASCSNLFAWCLGRGKGGGGGGRSGTSDCFSVLPTASPLEILCFLSTD